MMDKDPFFSMPFDVDLENSRLSYRPIWYQDISDCPLDMELYNDTRPPVALPHGHGFGPYDLLELFLRLRLSDVRDRSQHSQIIHSS